MINSIFWVALAAYILHILEAYFYDWCTWVRHTLKLPADWTGFYLTNTAVLFMGVACAGIGWENPRVALVYPSLMLFNGIFFHVLPTILTNRFSPGLLTTCLLFFPTCFFAFTEAIDRNVSAGTILYALGLGYLIMAFPVALLKTKDLLSVDQNP